MSMRGIALVLSLSAMPMTVFAQSGASCAQILATAVPMQAGLYVPLAIELAPARPRLGDAGGVLTHGFDEALSVDSVLLRIRQEGCRSVASIAPAASVTAPMDPAAYKPKTEHDNTPWRFNMTQNGKRMTADEFDAWMKAKGVRVVGRKTAPVESPPAPSPTK